MIEVVTFGCRLNTYESQIIRDNLERVGLGEKEDIIVFNTCSVTAEAERQVRQSIRKYYRKNKNAKIFVTGCAVEISGEVFLKMPEVFGIISNKLKSNEEIYIAIKNNYLKNKQLEPHITDVINNQSKSPIAHGFEKKSRAFIQIQGGCNHFCSYCVIPFTRGRSYSLLPEDIIKQIEVLTLKGYKEIVLTGVDIASYGHDFAQKSSLAKLIELILGACPDVKRLRLSSLDPAAFGSDLINVICKEQRILPHIHLSIQSGSNAVLKSMRRRHVREDVITLCAKIRSLRQDVIFGADFITGFPEEDDAMFQDTIDLVKQADISFLHVFPFSPRPKTLAAKMIQVPDAKNIAKQRALLLRNLGDLQLKASLSRFVGKTIYAIVEHDRSAKSDHFIEVKTDYSLPEGSLIEAKVFGSDNKYLFVKILRVIEWQEYLIN